MINSAGDIGNPCSIPIITSNPFEYFFPAITSTSLLSSILPRVYFVWYCGISSLFILFTCLFFEIWGKSTLSSIISSSMYSFSFYTSSVLYMISTKESIVDLFSLKPICLLWSLIVFLSLLVIQTVIIFSITLDI